MFLAAIWSSLCFASSMYRFIPPLVVLTPHYSNVAVCWLFCVLYMPLFGLVQVTPWFAKSQGGLRARLLFYLASLIFYLASRIFYLASRIFYLASRIFLSRISHFLSRISHFLCRISHFYVAFTFRNFFLLECPLQASVEWKQYLKKTGNN